MSAPSPTYEVHPDAEATLKRAADALGTLQDPAGFWKGELETNVTMDAEDMLLRQFLGIATPTDMAASADWIRSQQRPDGTWANFYGGPADLSTTFEAYVALKLAGDPVDAPHMLAAAEFVRDMGGLERTRVFTRIWMALFGLWEWSALPVMPPELVLLPPWVPLNVYDFGCWARQTVVALTVINSYRPVRSLPIDIDELRTGLPPRERRSWHSWGGFFERADVLLHRYERRPLRFLRSMALREAERWIVERQESDGGWGGIQPPWVYSLMALTIRGYSLTHPVIRAGLEGLEGFIIRDDRGRRLEACQSPVWDTALAAIAMVDAGTAADDPALRRAAAWLVEEEITSGGDWQVRRPKLAPGGWAFEFANDHYPDVDDTAEVVLALHRVRQDDQGSVERGVAWVDGMQCGDGGWAAFDADNVRTLCEKLPFADFGELIDPPSADVTAHVVEMEALLGRRGTHVERGVAWLLEHQEKDGSWFGRWGANYVYGTGAVVPALVAAGLPASHKSIVHAVNWLESVQQADGGWGEDLRSYDDPASAGRGATTASQTAWALLALLAAGRHHTEPVRRGVDYLIRTQADDGSWDEPWYTGTGFPGDFYINYHLYRLIFPVTALGRYVHGAGAVMSLLVLVGTSDEAGAVGGPVVVTGVGREVQVALPSAVSAVAAIGTAEALSPSLVPGQLVVADEVRTLDGWRRPVPSAGLVAAELRRAGCHVTVGPVVTTDGPVDPGMRRQLIESGALALDDHSAWAAAAIGDGAPLAVVRAVQAPEGPGAMAADQLRSLTGVRGPLDRWAKACGARRVVLAAPRSFCAGVERAIEIVERALSRFGAPVYVRRQIVHNTHVVERLAGLGAVFVEELTEVPDGSVVVLAAHGVSPEVRHEAAGRGDLRVVDATCPLVAKVHHEARRFASQGFQIVLVGHAEHEEVVGTVGEAPDRIHMVGSVADIVSLPDFAPAEPVAFLTQTTLATDETADVVDALRTRFPGIVGPSADDICYATQNRQDAVRAIAGECDLVLVVGSANSSNTARLVEVARREGCRAELVEDAGQLRLTWLHGARTVGLTAGASAPESLVEEVARALSVLGPTEVLERRTVNETVRFALPPQVR